MKLRPGDGGIEILFAPEEVGVLGQLVQQLILLLESHSNTPFDPDPLFASLEVGGTDETPEDPALARLLPDAFADAADAASFRRVTEQGLLNRKLQDAMRVIADLTVTPSDAGELEFAARESSPGAHGDRGDGNVDATSPDGAAAYVDTDDEDGHHFIDGSAVAVNITQESFPAWARTVTALRLAMAARIGLEREADYDRLIDADATRGTVLVYDWLAALLEAVLALGNASDET
ncbi:DUF2017 family protein [Leucobacter komagatae]|uniref:DUF2017 family protein n=1 Tax=Leucobacter komagatae TaxID=55969 RepID=UPI0005AC111C|nr:DUF2017 family protein [Leucobacter komagatae]